MRLTSLAAAAVMFSLASGAAAAPPASPAGRWNLTVSGPDGKYPSWIELVTTGDALSGRIVGRVGHAHPLARVEWKDGALVFVDAQPGGEAGKETVYRAKLAGGKLSGTIEGTPPLRFTGTRAPDLAASAEPKWGKPVALIDAGMKAWRLRSKEHGACWSIEAGVLRNKKPCVDLVSVKKLRDFKLHAEFNLKEKSNSGVYLRGRYEVQINDDAGRPPQNRGMGGVYGFLVPKTNPSKKAGEWQTYDITLVGRKLTVVLNGETIHDGVEIPGPTGGALDSDEATPGPLMLQGDHGEVEYRNITVTPAS